MKKVLLSPITYIILVFVLVTFVAISLPNIYALVAFSALRAAIFFYLGDMGKERRENIAKSIGGGGIKRPSTNVGG